MGNKLDIQLEVGDVVLTHTDFNPKEDIVSVASAGIRYFTKNYWNHAKYVVEEDGVLMIDELLGDGTNRRSLEDALIDRDLLVMKPFIPLTKVEKKKYCKLANIMLDCNYDYWGTFFFQLINQVTGRWIGPRDVKLTTPKYCSEAPMTLHHLVRGVIKKPWKYSPANIRNDNYFKPVWAGIVKEI